MILKTVDAVAKPVGVLRSGVRTVRKEEAGWRTKKAVGEMETSFDVKRMLEARRSEVKRVRRLESAAVVPPSPPIVEDAIPSAKELTDAILDSAEWIPKAMSKEELGDLASRVYDVGLSAETDEEKVRPCVSLCND